VPLVSHLPPLPQQRREAGDQLPAPSGNAPLSR
jgi:hypothetical protein